MSKARDILNEYGLEPNGSGTLRKASDLLRLKAAHKELMASIIETKAMVGADKTRLAALNEIVADARAGKITDREAERLANDLMNKEIIVSVEPPPDDHSLNTKIGNKAIQKAEEGIAKEEAFVNRVNDAKRALELSVSTFRKDSLDYMDELDAHLLRLRQARMALDTESKHILAQCADVRKFFLSEDHGEQLKRLAEFADTCQKLKALKESGFLDAVADTILKLEVK